VCRRGERRGEARGGLWCGGGRLRQCSSYYKISKEKSWVEEAAGILRVG
jgi:hypothetical protein